MAVLVGKAAPDFCEKAVVNSSIEEKFTLSQFKGKKHVVLFFYPLDFTYVCPTELHAFQEELTQFQARHTELVAVSVDSWFSHLAWLRTPRKEGGIQGVTYPIVSDFNKSISRAYDVLNEEVGASYRGLFVIDKAGVVQAQMVTHFGIGRNVQEALRLVDAVQFHEENGEVCPANWNKGDKAMRPTAEGLAQYYTH